MTRSPRWSKFVSALAPLVVAAVATVALCCGGCMVGPDYVTPEAPVASNWIDYKDPRADTQEQDLSQWWGVFEDPVLDSLIADAAQQNLTLRAAGWRTAEARARHGVAVGNLFPQRQEAAGGFTTNKLSNQVFNSDASEQWFHGWDAGFNLSWELDLWGRFRRAIEAADAELEASIA